ncbi:hypothetical protein ES332_D02G259300v1 [Gossypium tomentosum]|uniref:PUM-HD domain-containing protein n=1 Tax=Gossypium tomentosum TaxID=34277 RepID=A0A5D2M213_GOSTO|nr:hypothetical protein ES332_D02G259300v1 [Gossypium tomentosum]
MEKKDDMEGSQFPFMDIEETTSENPMVRIDNEGLYWSFMKKTTYENRLFLPPYSTPSFRQSPTHGLFQNPTVYSSQRSYPLTPNLPLPSQQSFESLEDSFRRMTLIDHNSSRLQSMRVESAVRGQIGLGFHNEGFGSYDFLGASMVRPPPQRQPSFPGFDVYRQRSRSFNELPYTNRRWPMNTHWGTNNSIWSSNGSQPENPKSNLFPPMYNNRGQEWFTCSSLKELKGRISAVAKDQKGCRLLQKKFDDKIIQREDIDMVISEVKDQLHELMVHQFANYVIQKLFEVINQQQTTELLLVLVIRKQRFMEVCTDTLGTWAVQKLMLRMKSQEQISILLSVLKPIAVTLTNNIHGHHIIDQCIFTFSNEDTKHIADEIANNCMDIATDKSGCCVLNQCLSHVQIEARDRMLAEIISNAFILSEHCYGNYVVQFVVGMRLRHVTSNLIMQLRGTYVSLSMNKYGSNVVEKCMKCSSEHASMIIKEIMFDIDFLKVLQDAYGNYVIQSALRVSKGDLYDKLVRFILRHYSVLHSHLFGKMVLDRVKCSKTNRV